MADFGKQAKLLRACELFIDTHQIRSPESCYQMDRVVESAPEFIEEVCNIVGYYEDQDND